MNEASLQRDAEARVGRVLSNKWRLERLLGVGGVAAVYEAAHRNGKRVAVKVLHTSFSTMAEVKERFLREGYAANAVRHPGAVSVMDDDETDDGDVFLVMDLLDGETLEARWTGCGQRLALGEVVALTDGVLDVLCAAHAAGIVHRDVKPDNVFVTRDGAIKLLDFGIAQVRELSSSDRRTQVGSTMGTPAFMPPEQARGRWDEVDARSDVWAVGAMMFCLLTGHYVHEAQTLNETLLAAMTNAAPPLASLCPDVPEALARVIDRALAFDRQDRWPGAAAMLSALREASRQTEGVAPHRRSLPASGPTAAPTITRLPALTRLGCAVSIPLLIGKARPPRLALAGAVALAAVFALVMVLVPHRSPPTPPATAATGHSAAPVDVTPSPAEPDAAADMLVELPSGDPAPPTHVAPSRRTLATSRPAPSQTSSRPSPTPTLLSADPLNRRR